MYRSCTRHRRCDLARARDQAKLGHHAKLECRRDLDLSPVARYLTLPGKRPEDNFTGTHRPFG